MNMGNLKVRISALPNENKANKHHKPQSSARYHQKTTLKLSDKHSQNKTRPTSQLFLTIFSLKLNVFLNLPLYFLELASSANIKMSKILKNQITH